MGLRVQLTMRGIHVLYIDRGGTRGLLLFAMLCQKWKGKSATLSIFCGLKYSVVKLENSFT